MEDHSFALPVKDRLSVKASKISWKIGHCTLISGPAPFQKMRKNKTGFSGMQKSIKPTGTNYRSSSPNKGS